MATEQDRVGAPAPHEPLPPKLLGSRGLKLRVAAASAAILAAGALLAPRAAPTAVPVSQERPVPLLQEEVQRREPARLVRGLQDIVRRVGIYSVEIPAPLPAARRTAPDAPLLTRPPRGASGYGVVVDASGAVLTHAAALGARMTLAVQGADGTGADARVTAHEADTGLVLLRVSAAATPAPIAALPMEVGALATAAVRRDGRDIASPVFVTAADGTLYSIASPGAPLGAGTPLYNLEGEAFALAAGPAAAHLAYPLAGAIERLRQREASGRGFDGAIGVAFQSTSDLTPWFPASGALVSAVVSGGPAEAAGVAPGDVLVSIAGAAVDSPAAAQRAVAALQPGSPVPLALVRGTRTVPVTVTASSAFELSDRRTAQTPTAPHPSAAAVFPPTALSTRGIPGEALLIAVNGRPVPTREAALRELRRGRGPALAYMHHDGERFFVAVEEPR